MQASIIGTNYTFGRYEYSIIPGKYIVRQKVSAQTSHKYW